MEGQIKAWLWLIQRNKRSIRRNGRQKEVFVETQRQVRIDVANQFKAQTSGSKRIFVLQEG